jgi:hypothetical protein
MNRDEFEDKQYHLSVTAGMNQRYHQNRQYLWTICNRAIQIAVGTLAVIGVCLAVTAALVESKTVDVFSIVIASAAAIAAIALNVLPLGDWAALHGDLLRRWTDLREDVDALQFDLDGEPTPDLRERLKQLDAKVHRICGGEPQFNEALLNKCFDDEEKSRHHRPQSLSAAAQPVGQ